MRYAAFLIAVFVISCGVFKIEKNKAKKEQAKDFYEESRHLSVQDASKQERRSLPHTKR